MENNTLTKGKHLVERRANEALLGFEKQIEPLLTEKQVAVFLGCSVQTLRNRRNQHKPPAYLKFDKTIRYRRSTVVDYQLGVSPVKPQTEERSDELLTEKQVAQFFNFSTQSIRNRRYQKKAPAFLKIGRTIRYKRREVEACFEEMNAQE